MVYEGLKPLAIPPAVLLNSFRNGMESVFHQTLTFYERGAPD